MSFREFVIMQHSSTFINNRPKKIFINDLFLTKCSFSKSKLPSNVVTVPVKLWAN